MTYDHFIQLLYGGVFLAVLVIAYFLLRKKKVNGALFIKLAVIFGLFAPAFYYIFNLSDTSNVPLPYVPVLPIMYAGTLVVVSFLAPVVIGLTVLTLFTCLVYVLLYFGVFWGIHFIPKKEDNVKIYFLAGILFWLILIVTEAYAVDFFQNPNFKPNNAQIQTEDRLYSQCTQLKIGMSADDVAKVTNGTKWISTPADEPFHGGDLYVYTFDFNKFQWLDASPAAVQNVRNFFRQKPNDFIPTHSDACFLPAEQGSPGNTIDLFYCMRNQKVQVIKCGYPSYDFNPHIGPDKTVIRVDESLIPNVPDNGGSSSANIL